VGGGLLSALAICLAATGCSSTGRQGLSWPQASAEAAPRATAQAAALAQAPDAASEAALAQAPDAASEAALVQAADAVSEAAQLQINDTSEVSPASFEKMPEPNENLKPPPRPRVEGKVRKATTDSFDELVLKSPVPVLVDFYADWCGPCRTLSPTLDELARETPDVRIVKVNIDRSPELAARYRVSSIPALRVFQQGKVTARHVGLANKEQIQSLLAR
jgi:thioredoxin 1